MNNPVNLRTFAHTQIATRLGALAYQVRGATKQPGADAVHDLRVAIRRFAQSLILFGSLLPADEVKRVRKRLKRVLDDAGQIRDKDIALEFFEAAGISRNDVLWKRLANERQLAERDLIRRTSRWNRGNFSAKWRTRLGLDSA